MDIDPPESREWSLRDLEVTFLHFDYRFIVEMCSGDRSLSIVFGSPFSLRWPGGEEQTFDPEKNETLGPLLSLLHRPVTTFSTTSNGECVLRFADGTELCGRPHPQFEAWEANGAGDLKGIGLLCGPGGGSPWG
jgi:hypothetical protein